MHMTLSVLAIFALKAHKRTIWPSFDSPCRLVQPGIGMISTSTVFLSNILTFGFVRTKSRLSGILPPSLPMAVGVKSQGDDLSIT